MKKLLKNKDFISGVIFSAIALFFYIFSFDIKITKNYLQSSRFLPQISSAMMLLAGLTVIVGAVVKERRGNEKKEKKVSVNPQKSILKVVFVFALLIAYFLLLELTGFIVGSIIFFDGMVNILHNYGARKQIHILAVSILTVLVIYVLFSYGFGIALPKGKIF